MKRPTKSFSCVMRRTKMSEGRKKYPCRIASSKRMMAPTITIPRGENKRTLPNRYSFLNMGIVYQKTPLTTNRYACRKEIVPQKGENVMATLQDLGMTLRCIKEEVWPVTSFKSFLDLNGDTVSAASIELHCPAGHSFTIEEAVQAKIISQEQAERILAYARTQFPQAKKDLGEREADGWLARSSDYPPNQQIMARRLQCVKCGAPAKWATYAHSKEQPLCLECRAAYDNFQRANRAAFSVFWQNTSGRPQEIFYDFMWDRFFSAEQAPVSASEAQELLGEYRKRAREESRQRARTRATN